MANWQILKAAIADVIKTNGNQEITGQVLQNVLNNIISNLGANAAFAGIATPKTNPGTPDQNVFYLASEPGVYGNFGGIELKDQVSLFTNENGNWLKHDLGIATSAKVSEVEQTFSKYLLSSNIDVIKAVEEIYIPKEIYDKYEQVVLFNLGKLLNGSITVQIYGINADGSNEKIVDGYYNSFEIAEKYSENGCSYIIDMTNLDQTAGTYQNVKIPIKKTATIIENSPRIAYKLGLLKVNNANNADKSKLSDKSSISDYHNKFLSPETDNYDVIKAVKEIYIPKEVYESYPNGVVLWNIGKLRSGSIVVQIYGIKENGSNEKIISTIYSDFVLAEEYTEKCSIVIDLSNLNQTAGKYQNIKIPLRKDVTIKELSPIILRNTSNNQWFGKKVLWLGTSVPYGQYATKSYALEAANKLGFTLINTSMPGQRIHGYKNEEFNIIMGGNGTTESPTNQYATCMSKEEYTIAKNAGVSTAEIASGPVAWEPNKGGSSYNRTWENIFVEENKNVDLWVFDVVPNNTNFDTTDWSAFDKSKWEYTDGSDFSEHRYTFIGALLFLLNKMYELNPKARCVFILGSSFRYSEGKSNLEFIKSVWNIPIIDMWGKINTALPSLKYLYSEYPGVNGGDTINMHPSTFAHEKIGNILANELLLIS